MSSQQPPPDGLILCGGQGRRVGGADKGLLRWNNSAAITVAVSKLQPLCGQLLVSANRNLDVYRTLQPHRVIQDLRPDFRGPLAGLEAAAAQMQTDRLLVVPCDLPLLDPQVLERLLAVLDGEPTLDAVYARGGEEVQYLCAALRRRAMQQLSAELDSGNYAVRKWYEKINSQPVELPRALAGGLRNLNHREDWAES